MMLHCDKCEREMGTYLYGPGGIEERAVVYPPVPEPLYFGLPDIVCLDCHGRHTLNDEPNLLGT